MIPRLLSRWLRNRNLSAATPATVPPLVQEPAVRIYDDGIAREVHQAVNGMLYSHMLKAMEMAYAEHGYRFKRTVESSCIRPLGGRVSSAILSHIADEVAKARLSYMYPGMSDQEIQVDVDRQNNEGYSRLLLLDMTTALAMAGFHLQLSGE